MICTRFDDRRNKPGIQIIGGDIAKGEADWIEPDGTEFNGYMSDLIADGGLSEIVEAIRKANEEQEKPISA